MQPAVEFIPWAGWLAVGIFGFWFLVMLWEIITGYEEDTSVDYPMAPQRQCEATMGVYRCILDDGHGIHHESYGLDGMRAKPVYWVADSTEMESND